MSVPFDVEQDDAISECVRLASIDQLGRELARRCEQLAHTARQARISSQATHDLVTIADARNLAAQAALQAGEVANAVRHLLGSADQETTKAALANASAARADAMTATVRWQVVSSAAGRGAHA